MRMFGLGATLALGLLASMSLTSCYDSEHLDITAPTVLDAPKYVISGNVWDFVTNAPLQGVSVSAPGGSATTDATGYYCIKSNAAQNGTISFSLEGYISQSRNVTMESANTGVVVFNADCYLISESDIPGIQLIDMESVSKQDSWSATENILVDLVNETPNPVEETLTFGHLQEGGAFVESGSTKADAALTDDVKQRVANYCKAHFGFDPMAGFSYVEEDQVFTLPGLSSLYSVNLTQYGVSLVMRFTLDGADYTATVNGCTGREYEPTIYENAHYHGHGHGHGHGGTLNAGGGIFE